MRSTSLHLTVTEAPPPVQIWARLDAHGNLLGWSESAIAGAPVFDHQPDCTPGLYWWDAEQGAFRSSLKPITPWDPPVAQQRFHDAAIKVREMVEAGTMAGADAVRFALRFDRQAAKLPPAHPVNQALKRIRLARVTRAAPRGDGA